MKKCYLCKTDKPKSEYFKSNSTKDKLHSYCKECLYAHRRALNRKRKENHICIECRVETNGKSRCLSCSERENLRRQNLKYEVLLHYSRKCSAIPMCCYDGCGNANMYHLTIDHINGDGASHRRKSRSLYGTGMYTYLRKNNYPEGYQVLCWNHQFEKGIKSGEYSKKDKI